MIPFPIPAIKYTIERDPKIFSVKVWRRMLKVMWLKVGRFWHRVLLKKHFTKAGENEYDYAERSTKYKRFKRKVQGKTIRRREGRGEPLSIVNVAGDAGRSPLVLTGKTRDAAIGIRDIRNTSKGVTVVLRRLPPHIRWRRHPDSPDMQKELSSFSSKDVKLLIEVADRELQREINKETGGSSLGIRS